MILKLPIKPYNVICTIEPNNTPVLEKLKLFIIPLLIRLIMGLITLTCRIRWINKDIYHDALKNKDKPFVLSMWHNSCTIAAWVMRGSRITVMVSDSKDGEYVSRLAQYFGIETIRGSSSSGSEKAIRSALKLLARKKPIAITPDGPRGPIYKMKSGALWFSASSKAPIIPLHIESSRQWQFKSWDKHCFPKPFSTVYVGVGEPIHLERSALEEDIESVMQQVEDKMMKNVEAVRNMITANR